MFLLRNSCNVPIIANFSIWIKSLAPTHLPSRWHVFPSNQHRMGPIRVDRGRSADWPGCQSSVVHCDVRKVYLRNLPIWIKSLAPTHLPSRWHVFPSNQHRMGPIGVDRGRSADCQECQTSVVHRAVRKLYLPNLPIWFKPLALTHLPSCWHVFPSNQHRM